MNQLFNTQTAFNVLYDLSFLYPGPILPILPPAKNNWIKLIFQHLSKIALICHPVQQQERTVFNLIG